MLPHKEENSYNKQKFCHMCKQKFNDMFNVDENYCMFWNHCHYTGKYRGAAHSICNVNAKKNKFWEVQIMTIT